MSAPADVSVYSKDHPFPAKITENRLLTKPGSGKETRHFVVSLTGSGLHYKAGDSLGVFPANRPADVVEILQRLNATGDEPVMLPRTTESGAFREALISKLALAGPTRRIVETLAAKATDGDEIARLTGLLAPESQDVLTTFLDEREFVDLLAEFPSARLTPQELVDHMRRLMPRLYSIASSSKLYPSEVHLTVAVVRYRTNGRERVGVCSSFLAERVHVGITPTPVFVSHSHFGPPADGAKDCIMRGPGHGYRTVSRFRPGSGRGWCERSQLGVFRRPEKSHGFSLRRRLA